MHLVQAKTLLPFGNLAHCKLGCFLTLAVGLYFPLNLTSVTPIADFFSQIVQIFSAIKFRISPDYQNPMSNKTLKLLMTKTFWNLVI